jgi:hypothetical protein
LPVAGGDSCPNAVLASNSTQREMKKKMPARSVLTIASSFCDRFDFFSLSVWISGALFSWRV